MGIKVNLFSYLKPNKCLFTSGRFRPSRLLFSCLLVGGLCLALGSSSGPKTRDPKARQMTGRPKRYFVNHLPEFKGGDLTIDAPHIKSQILTMAKDCLNHQTYSVRDLDGGLYVGTAGIAYMYYHLSQSPAFVEMRTLLINTALDCVKKIETVEKKNKSKEDPVDGCSFLLGSAGLHAVSAAIHHAVGDSIAANDRLKQYREAANICKPVNFVNFGGDELFVGRAGYLCGALWLKKIFKTDVVPTKDLLQICDSIIESGSKYAPGPENPLVFSYYNTNYLGAAHGSSSILQMLLSSEAFMNSASPRVKEKVLTATDHLLSLQQECGNFPTTADDLRSEELVHWCHGAPGVVYLMAKAYLITRDQKYLRSCLKAGDLTWERGLLRKGPGICHGVAGSGYVFLLLYRLTGDLVHLHRAHEFAKFLWSPEFAEARVPDRPYSLYEGTAGTVCFLADLLSPSTAEFPFFNIFK